MRHVASYFVMDATLNNRSQYKAWCFTLNNTHDYDKLNGVVDWQYMIAGKEVAPTTGTNHLQCYVYFNRRKTFAAVKKMVPGAHFEPAWGSAEENRDYCMEDGDYVELGTLPDTTGGASGGKATARKYKTCISLSKSGEFEKLEDIHPDQVWLHYHTMKRMSMDNPKPVQALDKLDNEWIWGEPGVGKSRLARLQNPGAYIKLHNKWWLGYQNQDVVIYDDLDKSESNWIGAFLKTWADHYPFPAETKGDGMLIRPAKIIVTSNYTPEDIWPQDEELAKAVRRRFKFRHLVSTLQ